MFMEWIVMDIYMQKSNFLKLTNNFNEYWNTRDITLKFLNIKWAFSMNIELFQYWYWNISISQYSKNGVLYWYISIFIEIYTVFIQYFQYLLTKYEY